MAKVPLGWRSMARCSAERELSRLGPTLPWLAGASSGPTRAPGTVGLGKLVPVGMPLRPLQGPEKVVEAVVFQHDLHDVADRWRRRVERKSGDGGGRGRGESAGQYGPTASAVPARTARPGLYPARAYPGKTAPLMPASPPHGHR